ncbi:MAG TPA: AAA family ATPase [Chitinophagaceae bacterium]|nr:AAA family ATPase [Chitinophagaceae bacterium]
MKINNIKIKNFICFNETEQIDFGKGLNIISGKNGGGKSQLFNAFYWAFFNRIYTDIGEKNKIKRMKLADNIVLLPDAVKLHLEDGETINTKVKISLQAHHYIQDDRIINYIFTRKCSYKKINNGIVKTSDNILSIEYFMDNQTEIVPKHQNKIVLDEIFPPQIRPFVWYQGETMEDLYKFEDSKILTNAIDQISYFPIYKHLTDIAREARIKIGRDIDKLVKKSNKISRDQRKNLSEKEKLIKDIEKIKNETLDNTIKIDKYESDIFSKENKLSRFDEFIEQKKKINDLESAYSLALERIDNYQKESKSNIINKWLLNGCDQIIKDSEKNLDILNLEIQEFSKMKNPVPLNLPGPEYVEKMIDDEICYICERSVEKGTDEMKALQRRLEDFKDNFENKILTRNYTNLNRKRNSLLNELPYFKDEMLEQNKKIEKQIKLRNKLYKEINNFYSEIGIKDKSSIDKGSNTARGLLEEIRMLKTEKDRLIKWNIRMEGKLQIKETKLRELESIKFNVDSKELAQPETIAKNYIDFFELILTTLRDNAYDTLIIDLENESNRLYNKYLNKSVPGKISISKDGADIYNTKTDNIITDLSMGQQAAMKLAIANSFLFISAKKVNKSYPLITDAPTSDLDPDNTYNLTVNLKDSFEQMIIMSKDYSNMGDDELKQLIEDANVSHFYDIQNIKIDENLGNNRDNKKSIIINKFSKN